MSQGFILPNDLLCKVDALWLPSKALSYFAVSLNPGVDQALPPERRAPVTPASSTRYHRRRSSGSRDERYRSGKAPCGREVTDPLVCDVMLKWMGGWVHVCSSYVVMRQRCGVFECPLVGCVIIAGDILPHKQIYPQGYTLKLSKQ